MDSLGRAFEPPFPVIGEQRTKRFDALRQYKFLPQRLSKESSSRCKPRRHCSLILKHLDALSNHAQCD